MPNNNTTLRGIAVPFAAPIEGEAITPGAKGKLSFDPAKCGVIFDTELLRYSGFWNGGFITWNGVVFNGNHGANPGPAGTVRIATKATPRAHNATTMTIKMTARLPMDAIAPYHT